ncbi:MAG: hypothetical protein AAFP89_08300 [Bacteroidota bacterium]
MKHFTQEVWITGLLTLVCMGILTVRKTDIPTILGMAFMTAVVGILIYFFTDRQQIAKGIWVGVGLFVPIFLLIDQMGWLAR